jgi:Ni,Fe-hydrogenase III small subunit
MKQIRKGVFETNSSSTHSICIAREAELTIIKALHFDFGQFGWEFDTLRSPDEKATYLYTGLIANNRKEDAEKIFKLLRSKGILVTAEEPIFKNESYTNSEGKLVEYTSYENTGYIDHSDEMGDFLNAVCEDENKLMSYLFSDLSFIITGNDNSVEDVGINVIYNRDEYYKGN